MSHPIEQSIRAAELSLQMEGLTVSDTCKRLCCKLLAGEITLEQYLVYVTSGYQKAQSTPQF